MSESQTVSTAIHEIAHARLHCRPDVQLDHDAPRYQLAELAGQELVFTNGCIDREALPEGLYCYELREGDSGYAATIEASVTVNHFGSVITTQPIEIPEQGFVELNDDNGLSFGYGDEMTIFEYVQHTAKDRRTKEVEAESVAYGVCQYYGIETAENSFGYIAHWSQSRDLPELRASLETMWNIARSLSEEAKERGFLASFRYPERKLPAEEEAINEARLADPEMLSIMIDECRTFREAYPDDRTLMNYRLRNTMDSLRGVIELALPRVEFDSGMIEIPTCGHFITDDEIDAVLGDNAVEDFLFDFEETYI